MAGHTFQMSVEIMAIFYIWCFEPHTSSFKTPLCVWSCNNNLVATEIESNLKDALMSQCVKGHAFYSISQYRRNIRQLRKDISLGFAKDRLSFTHLQSHVRCDFSFVLIYFTYYKHTQILCHTRILLQKYFIQNTSNCVSQMNNNRN